MAKHYNWVTDSYWVITEPITNQQLQHLLILTKTIGIRQHGNIMDPDLTPGYDLYIGFGYSHISETFLRQRFIDKEDIIITYDKVVEAISSIINFTLEQA